MPELITASTSAPSGIAREIDIRASSLWGIGDFIVNGNALPIQTSDDNINTGYNIGHGQMNSYDVIISSINSNDLRSIDVKNRQTLQGVYSVDISSLLVTPNDLEVINTSTILSYINTLPIVDVCYTHSYHSINIRAEKPKPPSEIEYLPTTNFEIGEELIGFTSDFIKPIDYDKLKTPLSPVDNGVSLPWVRNEAIDLYKRLGYGYSINNFLVGGSTNTNYPVDEDALEPTEPVEPPPTGEVINIVNVINVVTLPDRTPVDFTNFTLATDIDSVAWVVNFDIANKENLALLKPQGLTVKKVEININGIIFNCFIGRTSTSLKANEKGGVTRSIKCSGWSTSKLLSSPYHIKRSHTETSQSTPAGILNDELTGTGFTGSWDSVSWSIPADVFSYFDKAPLAAIAELAESVGAIIVADKNNDHITVKPRYPVSPWDWGTASVDFTLSESQFFTIDTDWIPQESPDSIFVHGEETGGVLVKCVKQGTAGLVTLPTVVNKHITDIVAGTERGRIEVAKAGFKEIIPVTTYVDNNGIIEPQSLLEVNDLEGGTWRGMVVGTSLSIKRNGNAIIQTLQIERHYD